MSGHFPILSGCCPSFFSEKTYMHTEVLHISTHLHIIINHNLSEIQTAIIENAIENHCNYLAHAEMTTCREWEILFPNDLNFDPNP